MKQPKDAGSTTHRGDGDAEGTAMDIGVGM
jgi:hypothetical protein